MGGIPQGITLTSGGGNTVKASISLGPLNLSAEAQVTQSGPNTINVKVTNAGGIPLSALGNLADFNISIPKLPPGVSIQSVSVTQQGVMVTHLRPEHHAEPELLDSGRGGPRVE